MQALIKVGDNQHYGRIQQRLQCSDEIARQAYIDKLTTKRICKTVAEAETQTANEAGLWKDGYLIEVRHSVGKSPGGSEVYRILFIELQGVYNGPLKATLLQNKTEFVNVWDERPVLKARSLYRFPYWNHLTTDELIKLRDPTIKFQPLIHTVFNLKDFELI